MNIKVFDDFDIKYSIIILTNKNLASGDKNLWIYKWENYYIRVKPRTCTRQRIQN